MSKRVSESEQIVMEILWQKSPLTSKQVIDRLESNGWNEKTVKTFLSRMVKKRVISYKQDGRKYLYSPIYEKEQFIKNETDGFIEKIFKGDVKNLLSTFVQNKQLSKNELEYLTKLLNKESHDDK